MTCQPCAGGARPLCVATTLIALALMTAPGAVHAQDDTVVFVHGLKSNGGTWDSVAPRLQNQLQLRALRPTLGWYLSYADQVGELDAYMAFRGVTGAGAVTHSNGGVVVREYLRTHASAPRINRHVTVATPHHGARLAYSALTGAVTRWGDSLFKKIRAPVDFYVNEDPNFDLLGAGSLVRSAAGTLSYMFGIIGEFVAELGYFPPGFSPVPVMAQLQPGSSTFNTLNGSAAISSEAASTLARVSISTRTDPRRIPFALFSKDWRKLETTRQWAMTAANILFLHYQNHPDVWLRSRAHLWLDMYWALFDINAQWQLLIGALAVQGGFITFLGNDGVVTGLSSEYPNYTRNIVITEDINHNQQTRSARVGAELRTVLTQDFAIQPRQGSSTGPITVTIAGPTTIKPTSPCSWQASASGGFPPYSYLWVRSGQPVGTGTVYTAGMDGFTSFTLLLEVRDGYDQFAWKQILVNSSPGAAECMIVEGD